MSEVVRKKAIEHLMRERPVGAMINVDLPRSQQKLRKKNFYIFFRGSRVVDLLGPLFFHWFLNDENEVSLTLKQWMIVTWYCTRTVAQFLLLG